MAIADPRSGSRIRGAGLSLALVVVAGLSAPAFHTEVRASEPAPKSSPLPTPGTYILDPPHTFLYFSAQHKVVGRVRGRFDKMSGTIVTARDPAACRVDVTIEAASVSSQNPVRDEDLRSDAYFHAEKFPTLEYHGRGIHPSAQGWVMDGTLTIRGISKAVPLTFEFKGQAPPVAGQPARVAFHARTAVKRGDFGMTRDLAAEVGPASDRPDVWIGIDAEAIASIPGK